MRDPRSRSGLTGIHPYGAFRCRPIADVQPLWLPYFMEDEDVARAKIAETLRGMLTGQFTYIEGARIVDSLSNAAGFDRYSEPFVTFVGAASESDEVPVGDVRDLWSSEAIAKHSAEWKRTEAWAKEFAEPACHAALALLAKS